MFATEEKAIEHAKANLKFFPFGGSQSRCPCGVAPFQEDASKPGECEQWGAYETGRNRTASPDEVHVKGNLDNKCRMALQRAGTLWKGMKWFKDSMMKPAFRKKHLADRARISLEVGGVSVDAPRALPDAPAVQVDEVSLEQAELKGKGYFEVYTDLNYQSCPENRGRTWQQDGRTLVPKRMANGTVKNLIYVWTGPEDRWTCTASELAQIQKRTAITNSLLADAGEVQDAASAAEPQLLPHVFQDGMEETEHVQAPADQVLPPLPPLLPSPPVVAATVPLVTPAAGAPTPANSPAVQQGTTPGGEPSTAKVLLLQPPPLDNKTHHEHAWQEEACYNGYSSGACRTDHR